MKANSIVLPLLAILIFTSSIMHSPLLILPEKKGKKIPGYRTTHTAFRKRSIRSHPITQPSDGWAWQDFWSIAGVQRL